MVPCSSHPYVCPENTASLGLCGALWSSVELRGSAQLLCSCILHSHPAASVCAVQMGLERWCAASLSFWAQAQLLQNRVFMAPCVHRYVQLEGFTMHLFRHRSANIFKCSIQMLWSTVSPVCLKDSLFWSWKHVCSSAQLTFRACLLKLFSWQFQTLVL